MSYRPQTESTGSPPSEDPLLPHPPFLLKRVMYTTFLVVFLLILSFCLDILHDNDLVSVILGCLVCIILQFILLSCFFKGEMQSQGLDEIGLIKGKIKLLFGQLNLAYVRQKNKLKYYHNQSTREDRLFDDNNSQVYENVMTHLRSKEEIDHSEAIRKVKQKWNSCERKLTAMKNFIIVYRKALDSRIPIFNRFQSNVSKIFDEEYREWQTILKKAQENEANQASRLYDELDSFPNHSIESSYYSVRNSFLDHTANSSSHRDLTHCLSWQLVTVFIEGRMRLNGNKAKELGLFSEDFKMYSEDIVMQNQEHTKEREKLVSEFKAATEERERLLKDISRTMENIDLLTKEIQKNKVKRGEGVELILKTEFQLRLAKVELENLEVRISRANSRRVDISQTLLRKYESQNKWLQTTVLDVFNNKLCMCMNQILESEQKSHEKLMQYIQQQFSTTIFDGDSPMVLTEDDDFDKLIKIANNRKKIENGLKNYLSIALSLCREISLNFAETSKVITQAINDLFSNSNQTNRSKNNRGKSYGKQIIQNVTIYGTNLIDRRFMQLIHALNDGQGSLMERCNESINRQLELLKREEDSWAQDFSRKITTLHDQYRRMQEQLRLAIKKAKNEEQNFLTAKLEQNKKTLYFTVKDYLSHHAVSYLPETVDVIIHQQQKAQKYLTEQQKQSNHQIETYNLQKREKDDIRKQRFENYQNYLAKNDIESFEDDKLNSSKQTEDQYYSTRKKTDRTRSTTIQQKNFRGSSFESESSSKENTMNNKLREQDKIYQHYKESREKSLNMVNCILNVLFQEWSNSEFFHEIIKEELDISLNRKRPEFVEHITIEHFKIHEKYNEDPIQKLDVHETETFRCLFDVLINFKGKIAVQIGTRLRFRNYPQLQVKLIINEFRCPIRVCFTPFSLGKSYASLLEHPALDLQLGITINGWDITKIPLVSQIIKTYLVIKFRKKMLWPKRMTLSIPLAFKSTIDYSIQQRNKFERERDKIGKNKILRKIQ